MVQGIYGLVYKDGVAYIGCGRHIRRRFNQHRDTLRRGVHRNFLLQRVWDKHGDVLTLRVLEEVADESALAEREQFYIDTLKPWANMSDARGSHPHTEEAKQKMRAHIRTEDHVRKIADALRGRPSPLKGVKTKRVPRSAFKNGIAPWNKGVTGYTTSYRGTVLTAEHRAKLSAAKVGNPRPDIAAKLRGRTLSAEHRANISAALLARRTKA